MPIKGTGSATKRDRNGLLKPIGEVDDEDNKPMLALPPSEGAANAMTRAVVSLPKTSAPGAAHHQMSTSTRDIENRSATKMIEGDAQTRDYNDLMDQFSLH